MLAISVFLLCLHTDSSAEHNNVVKIGVASMTTPVETVKYYQDIIDYIGEQIKQPVQMVYRKTYGEMDSLLEKGEVEIAFICSAPYVRNWDRFGVELLVAPSVNGSSMYHSYIIVHKDSPYISFTELRGKIVAFTDPKSNSGTLYPTYLLKTMGQTPNGFFKRVIYSYSHNKSVEMVAKKIVDGAAVESIIYEYMLKTGDPYVKQVKIIKRSQPFGIPPVVVTRGIDPVLRKKVRDAFLNIQHTTKGKAILNAMMIDRFAEVPDSNYDTVRAMEHYVSGTSGIASNARNDKTVYFGVIPSDNPRIIYEKFQPLLEYLAERTPYKYELVLKKNYEETVKALGNGETDVALLGPLTYLEARSKYGAICILKPRGTDGSAGYKSVIIKSKDSPIKELSELKGKSVAFAASKSTSGNLIPRYLFAINGIHLSSLSGYANFAYHDSVVKAILRGQYTAGAVRDSVARKYMKFGIETIASSESIPTGPLVVGPATPVDVINSIQKALLELNPSNSNDRKILNRLDEELKNGFIEASDKDYEEIRKKINYVPQTCGMGCHPKIRYE
ncbi:MAG: phosphate/phosphite/phosphonate ABC transporter substrate-binding protein [Nitrospirae bacterium]|nr:phosphate/phosphite/phosphonate ABC transporter substrate-binding protein [Nitrospirota bacterium]